MEQTLARFGRSLLLEGVFLFILSLSFTASAERKPRLGFVHISASQGTSVFGHAGILIDDAFFDIYQRDNSLGSVAKTGIFYIYRERTKYQLLRDQLILANRSLSITYIDLPEETVNALKAFLEYNAGRDEKFPEKKQFEVLTNTCSSNIKSWFEEYGIKTPATLLSNFPSLFEWWIKNNLTVLRTEYYFGVTRELRENQGFVRAMLEYTYFSSKTKPKGIPRKWRLVASDELHGPWIVLRPVGGALNIAAGLVQSVYGVGAVVITGKADNLQNGISGMLSSVPEIVFLKYRKNDTAEYAEEKRVEFMNRLEDDEMIDEILKPDLVTDIED